MKTNAWLIEYARAHVGCPYWFGCFGQKATAALLAAKKKQYPKYYTATDFTTQFGKQVFDCAGLIKGALWSDTITGTPKYNAKTDFGANGFYNAAKKKGAIKTFDKVNGRLVFKGTDKTKSHVGVYCDGFVYEAKGHAYGVIQSKFDSSWKYWAQCHLFSDADTNDGGSNNDKKAGETVNVELSVLKKGSNCGEVKTIQRLLNALGCHDQNGAHLTIDGDFGVKTEYAVKNYQRKQALTVDGIVGVKTWNDILK